MAFDGVTVAAVVKECRDALSGSRISKIAQPEADELLLTLKAPAGQYRLLLSANASLPLVYLTKANKPSPMTAPNFCMLLRKHIQNGRITDITQPGLERIMQIHVEHLNELGDLCHKKLIIEIMGKHSNIIFCDENDRIIDSIKHISGMVSSVREVLPGKPYFIPKTENKADPVEFMAGDFSDMKQAPCMKDFSDAEKKKTVSDVLCNMERRQQFEKLVFGKPMPLYKAIYSSFTGISPILAQELCCRSGLDADRPAQSFPKSFAPSPETADAIAAGSDVAADNMTGNHAANHNNADTTAPNAAPADILYTQFTSLMTQVLSGDFSPVIVYENGAPKEFSALPLTLYHQDSSKSFPSISALLETYYAEKNAYTRIRQKSADLRKIVQTLLERTVKKYDLQRQQIKDTEKRDKYKLYGELLHTYGYNAEPGAKSLEAENYYTGEMVTIPLDPTLTAAENAKKYFDRYGKLKRTYETLSELIVEVKAEIDHLESIAASLDIAEQEADLAEIKEELIASGYIHGGKGSFSGNAGNNAGGGHRTGGKHPLSAAAQKKDNAKSKPLHYVSSDGFDMYVGKNNYQNDRLTFRFATGNDWWFHAKKIPGSHVIVRTEGKTLPDSTFEEAAKLAAYYSRGKEQEKVEIDYVEKKHVKKPAGAKPGFVVYYTNYSMVIEPDIAGIQEISS